MPIVGMRVMSSRTRKKMKNSEAIILSLAFVEGCDYCAEGRRSGSAQRRQREEAASWKLQV